MTKILALYLPQFHQTKENNQWWGEGFTEWNVVKEAKKLSKYSIQPQIPLEGYYDLSKVDDVKNQTIIAKNNGVDGFVIYSYYSNGELLLDKPINIIHDNKDINIEYCFSWANHDWMRTWFEYDKEMLRKQEYAKDDESIINHFIYLLPFFLDERYIKLNNEPVFIIYDYLAIPNIDKYISIWNQEAKKAGFNGVHFVQTLSPRGMEWNKVLFESCFDFEPTYTTFLSMKQQHTVNRIRRYITSKLKIKYVPNYFDYKRVCTEMGKRCNDEEPNHWLGTFAGWDNTPRHKYNGTIYKNFTLNAFEENLKKRYLKSIENHKPFIIIDAWNEWGEGAYLEPDNYYDFGKLEVIKKVKSSIEERENNGI